MDLQRYVEASRRKYDALISEVVIQSPGTTLNADLCFKYVDFDGNAFPRFRDLANVLADHVILYCLSARRRGNPISADEWSRLSREAKNLMRRSPDSGEAGEVLLYFLLEAGMGAPQMVTKVELKTNPRLEVHGSDGIHMRMDEERDELVIYFGESKLYSDVRSALRSMRDSLNSFHKDRMAEHEIGLVTSHFKHADKVLRDRIVRFLDPFLPTPRYRIEHACLVGFSWEGYRELRSVTGRDAAIQRFVRQYASEAPRLRQMFSDTLGGFASRFHLEVFFLPFECVAQFRREFAEALA